MRILDSREYSTECWRAAEQYIEEILSGNIEVGRLERLAVERHVADLEPDSEARQRGNAFSFEHADRFFRFFSQLRHWKGEWAGQQIMLAGWQAFIFLSVFGWLRDDGTRRFREVYIQVARKNGKTTIAAGAGLYLFMADREDGAEVYTAATKRDQARLCHKDAIRMRLSSPTIRARSQAFKDNLSRDDNGSKFEPLGSNVDALDGLNPHAAIIDEFHAHKDGDLRDVLEFGMGSRRQPLLFQITTSGRNIEGPCYEVREHAEKILTGIVHFDSLFAFIAEPDAEDAANWADERLWRKGNPNLGISVKIDKLREELAKTQAVPSRVTNFRRYRLNTWVAGGADVWMDMDLWNACVPVDLALSGATCWGGLDLAATQDVASFVLYFPPDAQASDNRSHVLPFFWIPEDRILERAKEYRVPLEAWVANGWVLATPGNVIDYDFIRNSIVELRARYDIKEIGYDDWNATQIVTELLADGLNMVQLAQNYKTFSAPMSRLSDQIATAQLNHANNPVLTWMASNVRAQTDAEDRMRPVKSEGRGRRRYKIDGIVALLMAMRRWMDQEDEPVSVYDAERRGIQAW